MRGNSKLTNKSELWGNVPVAVKPLVTSCGVAKLNVRISLASENEQKMDPNLLELSTANSK